MSFLICLHLTVVVIKYEDRAFALCNQSMTALGAVTKSARMPAIDLACPGPQISVHLQFSTFTSGQVSRIRRPLTPLRISHCRPLDENSTE